MTLHLSALWQHADALVCMHHTCIDQNKNKATGQQTLSDIFAYNSKQRDTTFDKLVQNRVSQIPQLLSQPLFILHMFEGCYLLCNV